MPRLSHSLAGVATLALLAAAGQPASAEVSPHAGMLRFPDVSKTHVVFSYANDLWTAPRKGGVATPLASPPGGEVFPRFSDDGQTIAFVGNYDGDRDIYTIPMGGGLAHRVTHHPANEMLNGWTPDGKLVYTKNGLAGLGRQTQLFTVDAEGGLPNQLPVPYGANGAVSPDGQWLAYTPHTRDTRTWKRYRGGMATDIWLFNLSDYTSQKITDWEGTDTLPMWHKDTVYYLSDDGPEMRLNIWAYNTKNGKRRQVTNFSEFDCKWPSMGPGSKGQGEIILQNGPSLYLVELKRGKATPIEITIPGDRPSLRAKSTDVDDTISWWDISATGKRAVVSARGDVWTLPAEKGSPRNITRTDDAFERYPTWSPDGRWVSYMSDASGEYELYVTQSDGKGETRQLTEDGDTFRYAPIWSPDSKMIVFTDKTGAIKLHTIDTGETHEIDRDPWAWDASGNDVSWSHDSRWLTYARSGDDNPTTSVWIYSVEDDTTHQVTDGMFGDSTPTFDRKGNYLFFASSRHFQPSYGDLDTSFIYDGTEVILAVPLTSEIENPYALESDEEEWDEEEAESDEEATEEDAESEDAEGADEEPIDDGLTGTWEISLSGEGMPPGGMTASLILALEADGSVTGTAVAPMGSVSVSEGSFDPATGRLQLTLETPDGEVFQIDATISGESIKGSVDSPGMVADFSGSRTVIGGGGDGEDGGDTEAKEFVEIEFDGFESRAMVLDITPGNFGSMRVNDKNQLIYVRFSSSRGGSPSIKAFDINDEKKAEKDVATGAGSFEISGDGKKLIVLRDGSAMIQDASAGASGKNVSTKGMTATIEPREEWAQLLTDAWRMQRDFFYDPNMHGVDWDAVLVQYRAMLDDCVSREDVSFVIREMISELNVGHAYYRGGGDIEQQPSVNVGLLGCDFELADTDEGKAYRIAKIIRGAAWDADAKGPLSAQGVDVNEGDFLLAVNGVEVNPDVDPWASFIGTAGRATTLTVSEKPFIDEDARDVIIKPIASEGGLRYRAWVEAKRKHVEYMTNGRVGYVYVPNTGVQGQNELVRQFYGQRNKDGLIIDERWNGGGQIPTRFIELLNRPPTNYWARREGKDWAWPPDAHFGPKAMLINGLAGSGGDAFPYYFKQAGLGPLIGMRTWGGLVGIMGEPPLIDGASITVPTFAFYENDGTWGVEGHGVDPDIEIVDDPALMMDGGDPQLDAAIDYVMSEIQRSPYVAPQRPATPDRRGIGVTDSDR